MPIPLRRCGALFASVGALTSAPAPGQVPFPQVPDWTSVDPGVATGCGLADLDGDGWQDLVVAYGNDIARQPLAVYFNDGAGSFPATPDWTSADVDYHGHLSIGDVDGDGWLDVAVSVFLGPAGFSQKGRAKLYLNDGGGTLSSTPDWTSQDDFYSFSLALGDADGDGDLDLAVATGEPYSDARDHNRVYYNVGGTLGATPGWTSSEQDNSLDVAWGDMDGDGDLDLVSCNAGSPLRIHYAAGGALQATAGWSAATPADPNGNSLSVADLDGDGWRDVVFSDNDQLGGGSGRFLAYFGDGLGGMEAAPGWQSEVVGYVSGVVACDVQGDGRVDVLGGSWWGDLRMYLNDGVALGAVAGWHSSTTSVVEAIPLGDPDRRGLAAAVGEVHAGDGQRRVFYLERAPLLGVDEVRVDGAPLAPSQFCHDPEAGWLSLAVAPVNEVAVDYRYSTSVDFAVSNWDGGLGNFLFLRRGPGTAYCGPAELNSTGAPAVIWATGSPIAAVDDLHLTAAGLPPGQFGYFLTSDVQGFVQHPGGSQGNLCLAGGIGRFAKQVKNAGPEGRFSLRVDLTALPTNPPHAVLAGETWSFQAWFRDVNPGPTSNFTDGVAVTFD